VKNTWGRKNMYTKNDYSNLKGMAGFSDKALDLHFALYEGYVNNVNKIMEEVDEYIVKGKTDSIQYAELKRRFGWEFDGMRLHEYYFGALGGNGQIDKEGKLYKSIKEQFGDFETFLTDFIATGKMRGIGWAILYQDPMSGKLLNFWINEHDQGQPAGLNLILNIDVFEHAYVPDYGKDRASYIDAYIKNINWEEVEKRLK
jgi:Fe-Mn family superoxide dismutase